MLVVQTISRPWVLFVYCLKYQTSTNDSLAYMQHYSACSLFKLKKEKNYTKVVAAFVVSLAVSHVDRISINMSNNAQAFTRNSCNCLLHCSAASCHYHVFLQGPMALHFVASFFFSVVNLIVTCIHFEILCICSTSFVLIKGLTESGKWQRTYIAKAKSPFCGDMHSAWSEKRNRRYRERMILISS